MHKYRLLLQCSLFILLYYYNVKNFAFFEDYMTIPYTALETTNIKDDILMHVLNVKNSGYIVVVFLNSQFNQSWIIASWEQNAIPFCIIFNHSEPWCSYFIVISDYFDKQLPIHRDKFAYFKEIHEMS